MAQESGSGASATWETETVATGTAGTEALEGIGTPEGSHPAAASDRTKTCGSGPHLQSACDAETAEPWQLHPRLKPPQRSAVPAAASQPHGTVATAAFVVSWI